MASTLLNNFNKLSVANDITPSSTNTITSTTTNNSTTSNAKSNGLKGKIRSAIGKAPHETIPQHIPTNDDFIKSLDYEMLETRYQIYKYYPRYIHNDTISTPTLKAMIADKPIYSHANKHVPNWRNPGTRKTYIQEVDLTSGKMTTRERKPKHEKDKDERKDRQYKDERREQRRQYHELRKDQRKQKHELLAEQRKQRRHLRHPEQQQQQGESRGKARHIPQPAHQLHNQMNDLRSHEKIQTNTMHENVHENIAFHDPFDSSTLVNHTQANHTANHTVNHTVNHTHRPTLSELTPPASDRSTSMSTSMSMSSSTDHDNTLKKRLFQKLRPADAGDDDTASVLSSNSYDQTRSAMTKYRSHYNTLLRLKVNKNDASGRRRLSEQIGTYNLLLFYDLLLLIHPLSIPKSFLTT